MSALAKEKTPIEAPGEPSGQSTGPSECRSIVREPTRPYRDKERRPGEIVWVQRIEAEPKDWFECEVIDVSEDPITQKVMYRVQLVDGGEPGTLFEEGKWLQPDRLRDKDDRKRLYNHEA